MSCTVGTVSALIQDSEAVREAKAFEKAHPLSAEEPQMSAWNGGVSSSQLRSIPAPQGA